MPCGAARFAVKSVILEIEGCASRSSCKMEFSPFISSKKEQPRNLPSRDMLSPKCDQFVVVVVGEYCPTFPMNTTRTAQYLWRAYSAASFRHLELGEWDLRSS